MFKKRLLKIRTVFSILFSKNKRNEYFKKKIFNDKVSILKNTKRYQIVSSDILDKKILIPDTASFLFMFEEIFNKEIYKFECPTERPYIIDAGANIGLSTIYFKQLFPKARIVAFEPDTAIFKVLSHNIQSFNYSDISLIEKGLWSNETILKFTSEGADGGRLGEIRGIKENTIEIQTTKLSFFLNEPVDFLKIDIEGAELEVLRECRTLLGNVKNLFVEYHSFTESNQSLGELIKILEEANFRYLINSPGVTSFQPFIKKTSYLGMDMQLNIYAYRV